MTKDLSPPLPPNDSPIFQLESYIDNLCKLGSNVELQKCLDMLESQAIRIRQQLSPFLTSDPRTSVRNISIASNASQQHSSLPCQHTVASCGLHLEEIETYSRQLILPEFRVAGQLSLKRASVLIVGAGGLGCPAALYLGAAGVGRIGVVDGDTVDLRYLFRL